MKITKRQLRKLVEAYIAGDDAADPDNVISAKDAYRGVRRQSVKSIDKYRASVDKTPIGQGLMDDDPIQAIELGTTANPGMFTDHEKTAASIPRIDRRTERPVGGDERSKKIASSRARYLDGRNATDYTMIVELEDGLVVEMPFMHAQSIFEPKAPVAQFLSTLMYNGMELDKGSQSRMFFNKNYFGQSNTDKFIEAYEYIKKGAINYINAQPDILGDVNMNTKFVNMAVTPSFPRMEKYLMMGERMTNK